MEDKQIKIDEIGQYINDHLKKSILLYQGNSKKSIGQEEKMIENTNNETKIFDFQKNFNIKNISSQQRMDMYTNLIETCKLKFQALSYEKDKFDTLQKVFEHFSQNNKDYKSLKSQQEIQCKLLQTKKLNQKILEKKIIKKKQFQQESKKSKKDSKTQKQFNKKPIYNFKDKSQILKSIQDMKQKLLDQQQAIQEYQKYKKLHKIEEIKEHKNIQKDSTLYFEHLQKEHMRFQEQLQFAENQNTKLKSKILIQKQFFSELENQYKEAKNKLNSSFSSQNINQKEKLQKLILKENRMRLKLEQTLQSPYFSQKNDKNSLIIQFKQKQEELEINKDKHINLVNIRDKYQQTNDQLQNRIEIINQNLDQLKKQHYKLDAEKQKQENKQDQDKQLDFKENDIYKNIIINLTNRQKSKSNQINQYDSGKFAENYQQIIQKKKNLQQQLQRLQSSKTLNENLRAQKQLKQNSIDKKLTINKLIQDIKIIKNFYNTIQTQQYQRKQFINKSQNLIYSNKQEKIDNFEQNTFHNFLNINIDFMHLQKQDTLQKFLLIQLDDFEEQFFEIIDTQKFNMELSYEIRMNYQDFFNLIKQKLYIFLFEKNSQGATQLGQASLPLINIILLKLLQQSDDIKVVDTLNFFSKNLKNEQKESIGNFDLKVNFQNEIDDILLQFITKQDNLIKNFDLNILIYQGFDFDQDGKYFVVVQIQDKTYKSKGLIQGQNPIFDLQISILDIDLKLSQQNTLQILVFNDNKDLNNNDDIVGQYQIDLNYLFIQKNLSKIVPINDSNRNQKILISLKVGQNNTINPQKDFMSIYNQDWFNQKLQQLRNTESHDKILKLQKNRINYCDLKKTYINDPLYIKKDQIHDVCFQSDLQFQIFWKYLLHFFNSHMSNQEQIKYEEMTINKEEILILFKECEKEEKTKDLQEKTIGNSKNDTKQKAELFDVISNFKNNIQNIRQKNNQSEQQFYINLRTKNQKRFTKNQLQNFLKQYKIDINVKKLDEFFDLVRQENQYEVDLDRIYQVALQQTSLTLDKKFCKVIEQRIQQFDINYLLDQFKKSVQRYIQSEKISKFQFYLQIKREQKKLRLVDMESFIQKVLKLQYNRDDCIKVFEIIDKDKNQYIEFDEFCHFMSLTDYFSQKDEYKSQTIKRNLLLKNIFDNAQQKQISISDEILLIFQYIGEQISQLDIIDTFEVYYKQSLQKFNVNDLQILLDQTDITDNKKQDVLIILKNLLEEYEQSFLKINKIDQNRTSEVIQKVNTVFEQNYFKLKILLEQKSDKNNLIEINDFLEIFNNIPEFNIEDIDILLNPICVPFISKTRINCEQFLKFQQFYKNQLQSIDQIQNQQVEQNNRVNKVFQQIKQIGLKYGYDQYLMFSMFDKNNKGYLEFQDFVSVLQNMNIEFNFQELQQIFENIDSNNKQYINLSDFCLFYQNV